MGAGDKQTAIGIGGAVAACCAVHLIIVAGGVGALGGLVRGVLSTPYLIVVGPALLTITAVSAARGVTRAGRECQPQWGTDVEPVET